MTEFEPRHHPILLVIALLTVLCCRTSVVYAQRQVRLTVDPTQHVGPVNPRIYGLNLEYNSGTAEGGLWGEMIRNRGFEERSARGYYREGETIVQNEDGVPAPLLFGNAKWQDYELTLEAQKIAGFEGFLVLLRVAQDKPYYWVNLGGWDNGVHALEKVLGWAYGQTARGALRALSGVIEVNRWYKVRVRCEGPRFQVWLDGHKLLDYVDKDEPSLGGQVGISTWDTRARFRRFKVTTLDGDVLFEGLPNLRRMGQTTPATSETLPLHWQSSGPLQLNVSTDEPFNGLSCLEMRTTDPPAGIQQGPLRIFARETYHGSLWARSEEQTDIVIRLTTLGRLLDQTELPLPGSGVWTRLPFTLQPPKGSDSAWLQVELRGAQPVWIDQVSLVPQTADHLGGFHPNLYRALAELRPPFLRWPVGDFIDKYAWERGIGPPDKRAGSLTTLWQSDATSNLGTDEFIELCRRLKTEAVLRVKLGIPISLSERAVQDTLRDTQNWLAYCNEPRSTSWGRRRAANGYPEPLGVRYCDMSLGHFSFWRRNVFVDISNDERTRRYAADFTDAVRELAVGLKSTEPNLLIIAGGYRGYDDSALAWDRYLLEHCGDVIDYLDVQHFADNDTFAEAPQACDRFIQKLRPLLAHTKDGRVQLSFSGQHSIDLDWRAGLHAGALLTVLERNSDIVALASPLTSMRHQTEGSIGSALINFDYASWFAGAEYAVLKLWRYYLGNKLVKVAGYPGPLLVSCSVEDPGRRLYLKIVNPSDMPVRTVLQVASAFPIGQAQLWLIDAGLNEGNSRYQPYRITPQARPVVLQGQNVQCFLPPHSLGVVSVQRQIATAPLHQQSVE